MKVVGLVSGGKDSCYAMYLAMREGHEVVALANLLPEEDQPDELDSYMFQTVGHQLVGAYATCMGVPLFRKRIHGTSAKQDLVYCPTHGDEVEDLYTLLAYIKECMPQITGVASGAIASDYQRTRVENVCARLRLVSLAYLWHQPQRQLLRGMVESGIEAILVKVAALGLVPRKHLGRTLAQLEPALLKLNDAYGTNVCGEGGEYESLTLDCPLFTRGRIVLEGTEVEVLPGTEAGGAPVGYLHIKGFHVVPKGSAPDSVAALGDSLSPAKHAPAITMHSRHGAGTQPAVGMSNGGLSKCTAEGDSGGGGEDQQTNGSDGSAPSTSHLNAGIAPGAAAGGSEASHAAASQAGSSHRSNDGAARGHGHGACTGAVVRWVPPEWVAHRSPPFSRNSFESRPGEYDIRVLVCERPEYVQVSCRPVFRVPADCTENDTANALNDALEAVSRELRPRGLSLAHALFVHMYLANMGHFAAANSVYCRHLPEVNPPPRACVQVPLPPGCPAILDVLLARSCARAEPLHTPAQHPSPTAQAAGSGPTSPQQTGHHGVNGANSAQGAENTEAPPSGRKVLHVQSISAWAPSCIGPYSQANSYNGILYLAGQIPLHPPSMTLVPGGLHAQVLRAMASAEAVAVAMRSTVMQLSLGITVYYVSRPSHGSGGGAAAAAVMSADVEREAARRAVIDAVKEVLACGIPWSYRSFSSGHSPSNVPSQAPGSGGLASHFAAAGVPGLHIAGQIDAGTPKAQLLYKSHSHGRPSSGGASDEGDEEVPEGLEPYLVPPGVVDSERILPNVVFVEVDALPRGAMVEVQPLVVDFDHIKQVYMRLREAASASPLSSPGVSDAESDPRRKGTPTPPARASPALGGAATADGSPCRTPPLGHRLRMPSALAATHSSSSSWSIDARGLLHSLPGCATHRLATTGTRDSSLTGFAPARVTSGEEWRSNEHSCHASTRANSTDDLNRLCSEAVASMPADAPAGATAGAKRAGQSPEPEDRGQAAAVAGGRPAAGDAATAAHRSDSDALVTTVCYQGLLLKALFHLPPALFEESQHGLTQRLHSAVAGVLGSYNMAPHNIVRAIAWYDVHSVKRLPEVPLGPAPAGAPLQPTWVPCLGVRSTDCLGGTAAVLEVVAEALPIGLME